MLSSLQRRIARALAPVFRRAALDRNMDEEFAAHLEMRVDDLVQRGLPRDDAIRRARIEFGNVTAAKESARRSWGTEWLDHLRQDLRYAARMLRRNPLFATVAVVSLGIGIGAASTVFSVIDGLDLRALPFNAPDQLVQLAEVTPPDFSMCGRCAFPTSAPTASDWTAQLHSFAALGALRPAAVSWEHDDVSEPLDGLQVTPGLFRMLGVSPMLGREFTATDTSADAPPVLMLSYETWRTDFGGDRQIVGRQINVRGGPSREPTTRPATIVGVLPRGFHFRDQRDVWAPLRLNPHGSRSSRLVTVIGRLRPGISLVAADAELRTIAFRSAARDPRAYHNWGARVRPLRSLLIEGAGGGRFVLFAITMVVLCIAVINVAGLLLARAVARQRELAMRAALGASRGRLVRQLLVEGLVVGVAGGIIGITLALWGVWIAPRWLGTASTGLAISMDWRLVAFAVALSLAAGLSAAVLPALRSAAADAGETLHGAAPRRAGVQTASADVLVSLQITLVLVLLTAGAVLSRDFLEVRYLDLGYTPQGLQYTYLFARRDQATDSLAWAAAANLARARIAAIPGVESAALEHVSAVHPEIVRALAGGGAASDSTTPEVKAVTPDYFTTFGTAIVRGRQFAAVDGRGAPLVAIVNRAAATAFWPGANPLGRRLFVGDTSAAGEVLTIVGVSANVERGELAERHWPVVYRPLAQGKIYQPAAALYVRLARPNAAALSAAESIIRETLGRSAIPFRSDQESLDARLLNRRWNAIALDIFAAFGLLLAAMGVYGMVAYSAMRRTREIGVRTALGARRFDIIALLGRPSAIVGGVGTVAGAAGAVAVTHTLRSLVTATSATDPLVLIGSAVLLLIVVLAATLIPTLRASRGDVTIALRAEG